MDRQQVDQLIAGYEPDEYKWLAGSGIKVAQWVRMKCMFGCSGFGRMACCPPNTPSIEDCERFFREYSEAVIMRFAVKLDDPNKRGAFAGKLNRRLAELEREVFLAGYQKAFMLFMAPCSQCKECASSREDCKNPSIGRPTPEAMGIDVYGTAHSMGMPIAVRTDYDQTMNRYAFLLVR
jgi:predicted metal-binding protein